MSEMTKNLFYFSLKIAQAEHWFTGKSFSGALIFASVNPQYDKILFIEFPKKYKFTTCCVQILFWMSKQKNNFCTQHVVNLYFSGNSMNNLSSYCGLTDSRMRASDKDLPVTESNFVILIIFLLQNWSTCKFKYAEQMWIHLVSALRFPHCS